MDNKEPIEFKTWDEAYAYIQKHLKPKKIHKTSKHEIPVYSYKEICELNIILPK